MRLLTDYRGDLGLFQPAVERGWKVSYIDVIYHHLALQATGGPNPVGQYYNDALDAVLATQEYPIVMYDLEGDELLAALGGNPAAVSRMSVALDLAEAKGVLAGYYSAGTAQMQFHSSGPTVTWANATAAQMDVEMRAWAKCLGLVRRQGCVFPTAYDFYEGNESSETHRNLYSTMLCRTRARLPVYPVVCHQRRGDGTTPCLPGDEVRRQQFDPCLNGGCDGLMWWTGGAMHEDSPTLEEDIVNICSYLPQVARQM
jgi:hypothetical protein